MRSIASMVLVLSLASAVIVVGVLASFQNLRDASVAQALVTGRIERAFTPSAVWNGLLGLHRAKWQWFAHAWAGAVAAGFSLLAVWWLRLKRKRSWLLVALVCLLLAPGFYAAGRLALGETVDPVQCDRWLTVTLLGGLYALAACAFFAGVQLLSQKRAKPAASR